MNKLPVAAILVVVLVQAIFSQELSREMADHPREEGSASSKALEIQLQKNVLESEVLSSGEEFTLSKNVNEVNVILSVTDRRGKLVSDLKADELKLLDNNKSPERLTYFQPQTNLPLHVILAIDVSNSIASRLHFEQRAASAFLKRILREETDQAAIVAFASTVQEKTLGMTNNRGTLDVTIRSLVANGETAMYDAIIQAARNLHANRGQGVSRSVIILISDGMDTASKATLAAAEEAAIRSEVAIFALDSNSIYETDLRGRKVLDRLCYQTGGTVLPARVDSELTDSFKAIERLLRNQYALGYSPPGLEANGSYRTIAVIPTRRNLRVHARKGYYAPTR